MTNPKRERIFTNYEAFVIALLAFLQFTIVLDFMVLSPLGPFLMEELTISPSQFGWVVSAYAFSAGIAGLLAAGFADRFDRKKMLLFFYAGFMIGTILCAVANDYHFLLVARIITGLFGGVIGSVSFAIITDLFKWEVRGRVMGFVQMAFAASQVLGLPIGLVLSNQFGWHSPFWMISIVGIMVGGIIAIYMRPIADHLQLQTQKNAFKHLSTTVSNPTYLKAFLATTLLATGGFMLMPFGSAFSVYNLGLTMAQLPLLYGITGAFNFLAGPLVGRLADKTGKFPVFVGGTILSIIIVLVYTNLGVTPLWAIIILSVIMFVGITSRMISSSALLSAVPDQRDRGAFMSISSSVQQISGGIASAIAGMIVVQEGKGPLLHYPALGITVVVTMVISIILMNLINTKVTGPTRPDAQPASPRPAAPGAPAPVATVVES